VKIKIEELGEFEGYPNRNSLPYIDLYGIHSSRNVLRGTLRNSGWCQTIKKIVDLGLLNQEEIDWTGFTYKSFMRELINNPAEQDLRVALGQYLDLESGSEIIDRLEWLGLFEETPLSKSLASPLDILGERMLEKLQYGEGERDMIILQHAFEAKYSDDREEKIISTLIDYGIPHGDSSMARTVGLPAAIGTRLILEGKIDLTGVHIPVVPEIYRPVLEELKGIGIEFKEKREDI
jgi:saccharopine dehydrogenase-like NADP-dependent oxidoreductase